LGPPSTDAGHDAFTALTHWVEDGAAAAQIVATKFVDDDPARGFAMQRPLLSLSERRKFRLCGHEALMQARKSSKTERAS
jgi:feruloyl esterase